MLGLALAMTEDRKNVVERAKAERRQFVRVPVELSGRLFVPAANREGRCQIADLSPGGAQILSEIVPPADAQIILYVDGFGRFEGTVVRPSQGSFGVRFQCSAAKREKTAEQLTLYMNRHLVDDTVVRRHDRAATKGLTRCTRANGDLVNCEVLDLSLSGVSLKTDVRPPLGEIMLIGQTAGRVVRHHENGIALEFVVAQPEKTSQDRPANSYTANR